MQIKDYIAKQTEERQRLLKAIHEIIVTNDKTVIPTVGPMMGKEMILYKAKSVMKYGLASAKNYITLHILPIYGSPKLYAKYKTLLQKAKFQKGCINFSNEQEMPLDIIKQLIIDCSFVDLQKIREEYIKSKKTIIK